MRSRRWSMCPAAGSTAQLAGSLGFLLNERGGIESDVTIARVGEDRFMIMTGSASGRGTWMDTADDCLLSRYFGFRNNICVVCLGLWGPNANAILGSVTDEGLDATAVPPYTIRRMFVAGIPVLAVRMSYVGEEGLELHAATEYGAALWEAVWEAGRAWGCGCRRRGNGLAPTGGWIQGAGNRFEERVLSGRSGACFYRRSWPSQLHRRGSAVRAGAEKQLSCMTIRDSTIMPLGKEPILAGDDVVGYVSSAGSDIAWAPPLPTDTFRWNTHVQEPSWRSNTSASSTPQRLSQNLCFVKRATGEYDAGRRSQAEIDLRPALYCPIRIALLRYHRRD